MKATASFPIKLRGILFWVFATGYCVAGVSQNAEIPDTRIVVCRDSAFLIRAQVMIEEDAVKYFSTRPYYSYFKDKINRTQGGSTGKLLHGTYQKFSSGEVLVEQGEFKYGLKTKLWKSWHPNGNLKSVTTWKKGEQNGLFEEYNEKGLLVRRGKYKAGKLAGKVNQFEDGVAIKPSGRDSTAQSANTPRESKPSRKDASHKNKNRKNGSDQKEQKSLPEKSAPTDAGRPIAPPPVRKDIIVFVVEEESGHPVKDASIKVNKFIPATNAKEYQFFGQTDENGRYVLPASTEDYVLFLTYPGFDPLEARVFKDDNRSSFLLKLKKAAVCVNVTGKAVQTTNNIPVPGALIRLTGSQSQSQVIRTDRNGRFTVCLPCGNNYAVDVSASGFESKSDQVYIPSPCPTPPDLFFLLNPLSHNPIAASPTIPQETIAPPAVEVSKPGFRKGDDKDYAFLVIAGTFSNEANAGKRLKEVKDIGFADAFILQYPDSKYYAVCVAKCKNEAEAGKIRSQVQGKGKLSAFVKKL